MNKLSSLVAAALVVFSSPALAASATITYYSHSAGAPSYSTAGVVQDFAGGDGSNGGVAFAANTTNNSSVMDEVLTLTPPNSQGNGGGSATLRTGIMQGAVNTFPTSAMELKKGSYTINFTAPLGIQYLSFLIGNYQAGGPGDGSQQAIVQYVGQPANAVNIFSALTIGSNGYGLIVLDRGGLAGISSITFSAEATNLTIDSIAAAAPEPAAWLMMIFGFGLAGAQLRRRRAGAGTVKLAAA